MVAAISGSGLGLFGSSLSTLRNALGGIIGLQLKALAWKPLVHMGTVSYGIYLFHPVCLMVSSSVLAFLGLYRKDFFGSILIVLVTSGAAVLVATLSFHLFESRFMKLKKYFVSDRSRAMPSAEAV